MNQILITKKLYITPELKRKKKIYKANFVLSIFFLVILISIYIYAAYARDKAEAVSQEILQNAEMEQEDNTVADSDVLIAVLNDTTDDGNETPVVLDTTNKNKTKQQSASGYTYVVDGKVTIPKINVEYAILDGESDSEAETEETPPSASDAGRIPPQFPFPPAPEAEEPLSESAEASGEADCAAGCIPD